MRPVQVAAPRGTAPFFAWRKRKEATLDFNWQYHVEYELTYILRGRGARFVGDATAFYAPGDLVLLAPSVPHSWAGDRQAKTPHECIVLHFAPAMIPGHDTSASDTLVPLSRLLADSRKGVGFHGVTRKRAVKLMSELGTCRPLEGLSRFYDLLDVLCQSKSNDRKCLSTRSYDTDLFSQAQPHDELSRVVAFVKSNHRRAISIREAAASISRSPSAFTRFFRRSTGRSFVAYLNEFRIAQAAALLLNPGSSVAQVARSVGFHNLAHFNRLFLKLRGETPTNFRTRTMKFISS